MRSRLRALILRELPNPLRWFVLEYLRFVEWVDLTVGRLVRGLRDAPAWYFMTTIGSFAVLLTLLMFLSVIEQTSGRRAPSRSTSTVTNLSRRDLEANNDWAVQDRWRVAHLFVPEQPERQRSEFPLDSRLLSGSSLASRRSTGTNTPSSSRTSQSQQGEDLAVRLDLGRPKMAQQGKRVVAGTVFDPAVNSSEINSDRSLETSDRHLRARDAQLLVQASWEFGPDCYPMEVVSPPIRRPKLVPQPEPEPEPVTVPPRQVSPDLSFEMAMIRHFSTAGQFPPGSHLVKAAEESSFPDEERQSIDGFAFRHADHSRWKPFDSFARSSNPPVSPYSGIGSPQAHPSHPHPDEYDETLRAVADVALRVELDVPTQVSAGHVQSSRLHLVNEGQDQISRIEVRDFPSQLNTVVGATPEATSESIVDPETGLSESTLHREIPPLMPGEEQDLELEWLPQGPRRQSQRTQVIAHTEISTLTQVTRPRSDQPMPSIPPERVEHSPALACDIAHLDRVYLGDDLELEITVRNTGDTTLHRVKVEIEIPEQFRHHDGKSTTFHAGSIPVQGLKRTMIRLTAVQAGDSISHLRVHSSDRVEARGKTSVRVVKRPERPEPVTPVSQTRESVAPTAAKRQPARITPSPVVNECCCQRVTYLLQPDRLNP